MANSKPWCELADVSMSSSSAALPRSKRTRPDTRPVDIKSELDRLLVKQSIQFDTRLRYLEGAIEDALELLKRDPIAVALRKAGQAFAQKPKTKDKGPAHLYIYAAFVQAVILALRELQPDHPLVQVLQQHLEPDVSDPRKLDRLVKIFIYTDQKTTNRATLQVSINYTLEDLWSEVRSFLLSREGAKPFVGPPPKGPMIWRLQELVPNLDKS
eukprot:TRINITY_DN32109_c0_g1_i1.p1 TRINITY_DN32109_c0_g1~~TRINITY_DN32109_c0_g1_i1.p1  ORF type:complete len:229 (+),score=23.18 TRINITY_DN32109_c0_g1_i1:50-688(+)